MLRPAQWEAEAERLRAAVLEKIVFRGEAARWRRRADEGRVGATTAGGPGYRIRKLRFEALPGMWIPALLYLPDKLSGKLPAIMNVHGHSGLIEQNVAFTDGGGMEPFCFGLLESLDIKHLAALAAPRPVLFLSPTDRAKIEMAELPAWRRLLDK